jgi:PAS domain S-box-containing protein
MNQPARTFVAAAVLGGVLFIVPPGPLAVALLIAALAALVAGLTRRWPRRWGLRIAHVLLFAYLAAWAYTYLDDWRLARGGAATAARLETAKLDRVAAVLGGRLQTDRALAVRVAGALAAESAMDGRDMVQDPELFVSLGRAVPPLLPTGVGIEVYDTAGSLRAWWGESRGGRLPADSVVAPLAGGVVRRPAGYTLAYAAVPWSVESDSFVVAVKDLWAVETPLRRGVGETDLVLTTLEQGEDLAFRVLAPGDEPEQPSASAVIRRSDGEAVASVVSERFMLRRYLVERRRDVQRMLAALYLWPLLWATGAIWQLARRRHAGSSLVRWAFGLAGQTIVLVGLWGFVMESRFVALLLPDAWFSPLTFATDFLGPGGRSPGDLMFTAAIVFLIVLSAYTLIPRSRRRLSPMWALPAVAGAAMLALRVAPATGVVVERALQSMSPSVFFSSTLLFSPPYLMVLLSLALLVAAAIGALAVVFRWLNMPTGRGWVLGAAAVTVAMLGLAALNLPGAAMAGRFSAIGPLLGLGAVGAAALIDAAGRRRDDAHPASSVRFSLVAVGLACVLTFPIVAFARVQAAHELLVERAERIGAASTQWLQYTMTRTIEYLATEPEVKRAIQDSNRDAALLLWNQSPLRTLDFASGLYLFDAEGSTVSQFALSAVDLSGRARRYARETSVPRVEIEGAPRDRGIWWAIVPVSEVVDEVETRVGAAVAMTTGALELREPAAGSAFVLTDLLAGSGPPSNAPQITALSSDEVPPPGTLLTTVVREGEEPVQLAMPLEPLLPTARSYAVFAFVGVICGMLLGLIERWGDVRTRGRWWASIRAENPLHSFRLQLLLAFLAVAAVPLTLYAVLGYRASRQELQEATRAAAAEALAAASRMVVDDPALERGTPRLLTDRLRGVAEILQQDLVLYWQGRTVASSRPEIFASRLFADRMPGEVYAELFGVRRPLAYQPLVEPEAPAGYVLATPLLIREDRARADLQRLGEGVFLLSAFSLGFLLIVSGGLSRYMARPLSALERGTRQIAAGRLSYRLPSPARRDEFGRLQGAFNAMAEQLDVGQRALEREKSRVQAILASVGAGVVALDERGRIRLLNDRAASLLGQDPRDVIDRPVGELVDDDGEASSFWRAVRSEFDQGGGDDHDLVVRRNGEERHYHMVGTALRDAVGKERGLVVAFEDITGNVQSQRVLAWGEMARQVAHEIKNPLTPMKLSLQHLERTVEDRPDDFQQVFHSNLDLILAEVERLERIASNFARFAVPDPAVNEPFDAEVAAREVVALFEPGEDEVDYSLDVVGQPRHLRGDPEGFRRILVNLLQNSREAVLAADGGSVRLQLDWKRETGWAWISVVDDGIGLPAEGLDRLFEPSFSTKTRGTGLGLAITRRIVEAWGGTIDYERPPDGGTAIHVRLPTVRAGDDAPTP